MKLAVSLILGSLLIATSLQAAETETPALHPKVQDALAWEIPANECGKQPSLAKGGSVLNENVDGLELQRTYNLDSNTANRYKRRQKRWLKCMTDYNQGIVDSIETLRGSAQYGLTEPQAKIILQKMVNAQAVLTAQRTASEPTASN